jgi:hypothetical protein
MGAVCGQKPVAQNRAKRAAQLRPLCQRIGIADQSFLDQGRFQNVKPLPSQSLNMHQGRGKDPMRQCVDRIADYAPQHVQR